MSIPMFVNPHHEVMMEKFSMNVTTSLVPGMDTHSLRSQNSRIKS